MSKLILLSILASLSTSFFLPETCTVDAQKIVDDIFIVAESFERDYTKPDAIAMKGVLDSV